MSSPFRNIVDDEYDSKIHNRIRRAKTLEFLTPHENAQKGLDIGERSFFTGQLENLFGIPLDNTSVDLDVGSFESEYDVITCFEVIEHLFNPLHCLLEIKKALSPGGRIYLSTPCGKPRLLWSPHHFHEMSSRSINALLQRAGLSVVRQKKIRILPWWHYLTGFRPLLRGVCDRTWLFELKMSKGIQ